MPTALIVLAAGQGSRMRSDRPKVLHEVAHAPLLVHALRAGAAVAPERVVVVAGHGGDAVEAAAQAHDDAVTVVRQTEQLGTGHAVLQARDALAGFSGDVIVLYGDTPFIRAETLQAMLDTRADGADVVVLGFEAAAPGRYGRLIAQGDRLERIVEAKDATPEELAVTLCNSGVLAADAETLFALLDQVGNDNAAGEYYLTDVPGLARAARMSARVVTCPEAETLGVNTRADLAAAEAAFQARARAEAMEGGVTLVAPETVHLAYDTVLGRDVIVEPNVVFGPGVTVENGATIRAFTHLEGCHISEACVVGPYARLRPGAELDRAAKVGNFVEVKAAQVHEGAKINHLSYVGDAEVGARANIGAGTITCNYDGVFKHRTEIGADAFIGSNTALVAPVRVGAGAMTASGSVITQDVPDGDLALGRAKQVNKDGLAARLMAKLKAAKARGRN
ncbi:bifunctional UDP-N-acetylglucosamine diphosphorylase/glucosamine-1-phosphate N-acetyltransferase GlmU [Jannaschia seohaensis]|uniref:Bifunctional protein GlmU n=1 Tax=Jannaschia seohaensis TaxID=475081 RepID=A0A2Y9B3A8_9RHOB|nr:bifunctional UDP-N-acetylglucosamine diphosphorylase/glucosamine-1-phosphate N-acetyltransferase GlmU [Jannaschia seohaensis]PWJ12450.1 bifunctional UDP-N-acetylglucosamine pyrophosphorylase/glucosamine-1-phosphate N-acetyltransferase [Jannaschia seohaensis]SSA50931.1 bifunctional UDP-N-acetylglucosamine pyrophosphorylase / Glucosamine-1-phosphate N-acetyltransferase [Jannaschia seohaensis]